MSIPETSEERAPQQDRSRQSWERVLRVGMDLFEEQGWSGLTINEVCRRADVSVTSIYARVNGKAGLFLAVHERWLTRIRRTEDDLFAAHVVPEASVTDAAESVAAIVLGIFASHRQALRALIDRSAQDEELLARGAAASQRLLRRLAQTLPMESECAESVVRAVYADCLLRVMYGPRFLVSAEESEEAFRQRVRRLARTLAAGH